MSKRSLVSVLSSLRPSGARQPLPPLTKKLFLLSFLFEFIVIYPFYVIMFGERGDVPAAGIGVLLAVWMIVAVAAEVPTGVIADKFSKKWSLVLGCLMQLLTFATWLVAPNFTGYLIGFIIWGIGEAFLSGAFEAYLYESIDKDNKQAFGKVYARSKALRMFAYTAAYFAAFLIGPRYELLLVLSMAVSLSSLLLTLGLPSTRSQIVVEDDKQPQILASAFKAVRRKPGLWQLLVAAVVIGGLMGVLGEYLPAYYQQAGLPTQTVALWMSLGSAAAALLYWWMHHAERFIARWNVVILAVTTGLFALSFAGGVLAAVLGMFAFTRILRVLAVYNETLIQHASPDESRATVGSLYSFCANLLSAGMIALVGFFAVDNRIVVPLRWSVIIAVAVFVAFRLYLALRSKKLLATA